jgi:hypothetical protein
MSRFHKYSVNNTMLIFMQKPDATLVAGFNKWRDQFGRSVRRGKKESKSLRPRHTKRRLRRKSWTRTPKLPVLDENGKTRHGEKGNPDTHV